MRMRASIALAVALCWVAGAAHAVSFTLDAIPSGPLTTGNGALTIGNIQFTSLFDTVDAGDVTFEVLEDGVKLSGPVTSNGDGLKSFFVTYDLTATSRTIDGASLLLDSRVDTDIMGLVLSTKQVLGEDGGKHGAKNWPFEDPVDLDPLNRDTVAFLRTADWQIFDDDKFEGPLGLGDDGAIRLVEKGFDGRATVRVIDAVVVTGLGGSATWESSTNRFTTGGPVIPEPGTAALTAVGLLLLALRRRSH
jgi:hypothetical protein